MVDRNRVVPINFLYINLSHKAVSNPTQQGSSRALSHQCWQVVNKSKKEGCSIQTIPHHERAVQLGQGMNDNLVRAVSSSFLTQEV